MVNFLSKSIKKLLKPIEVPNKSINHASSFSPQLEQKLESYDDNLENELCATVQLEGDYLSYFHVLFDSKICRRALIDTGSCANAIPQILYENLRKQNAKHEFIEPVFKNNKLASGSPSSVSHAIRIHFEIAKHTFSDDFLVLPTMNTVVIGNRFVRKNFIWICRAKNAVVLLYLMNNLKKIAEIALTSSAIILISAINTSYHSLHIKADTAFEILNQSLKDRLINIDLQLIALAKLRDPNDLENGRNQLMQVDLSNQRSRPSPEHDKL